VQWWIQDFLQGGVQLQECHQKYSQKS
jgi:hypothetical protein